MSAEQERDEAILARFQRDHAVMLQVLAQKAGELSMVANVLVPAMPPNAEALAAHMPQVLAVHPEYACVAGTALHFAATAALIEAKKGRIESAGLEEQWSEGEKL